MKSSKVNLAFGSVKIKLGLWFCLSLALSLVFFQEFWASLEKMLSVDWVFNQNHAAPWGVLGLCIIWLWLKRRGIKLNAKIKDKNSRFNFALYALNFTLGAGLVVGAILMPSAQEYLVFQVLLASLGVFIIVFGKAARIPSLLLGIYGFAISFPVIIGRFAELPYSIGAIKPMMWVMTTIGYPLENLGQLVSFTGSSGEPISVAITAACAGPATMGVFLAIFALMMLDIPLPPKKAVAVFLFGVVGTWLQSVIRLIILMLVGYHFGESALWTAHFWTIYILFPLWYLLFVYIYFRQAGSLPGIGNKIGDRMGETISNWKASIETKGKIAAKRLALVAVLLVVATVLFFGVNTASAQTWDSYSDAGHGTQSDSFTALNCTVYMYGTGFGSKVSYKIIYWDGSGYKRVAEVVSALANGRLSSQHTFGPPDVAGDWHCTVYSPDTYDTASYDAGDANIVADDTSYTGGYAFNAAETAIPEFPTVATAIGVGGLCFGVYWWERSKRLRLKMQRAK